MEKHIVNPDGVVLDATIKFCKVVKDILQTSFSIQINEQDWLPLYTQTVPQTVTKEPKAAAPVEADFHVVEVENKRCHQTIG